MWAPDNWTLFLVLFLVNVSLTLVLFSFWKTQKTYDGFRTWMLGLLVTSCGYFLFMIGGSAPVLLSTTVANTLIALSVMMRLGSTSRYFLSRPLSPVIYGTIIPAALLLLWFTFRVDSVVARGVIVGLVIVPCFLATSFIAIQFREPETRPLRYCFAAALMVTALLWTVITVAAIVVPGDHSLTGPDPLNPIFFTVTILMDIVSTVFFLLLNMARSEAWLRESEERYRNLADNLPDYILVHDREFIRYANPAAARLAGSSRETLAGQPLSCLLTAEGAESLLAYAPPGGDPAAPPGGTDIRFRDGTIRHCLIKTVRIEDTGVPACLSVITDITDRKAAEEALSRTNKKLRILSSVTRHDLKNQLMALSAYLDLSQEELDTLPAGTIPAASEYLRNEMRIAGIMEHQIDFTKAYEDMGTTDPAWQNVSACVRRAVASLPAGGIRVDVDRTDLLVYADPLFEKVFYNLIDNALKYGGETLTSIRISCQETGTGLVLTCADDGAGISREDKNHLFGQGYGKHTGLGLFLTREILSITGIAIRETGEPGNGACFEITVPKGAYRFGGMP